jgi:N-acetylneuraminate synthase
LFWPDYRKLFGEEIGPVFAVAEGERFGFLSFKSKEAGWAGDRSVELSINLAPTHRGRGLGREALCAVVGYLGGKGVGRVTGEIRVENMASRRAFLGAGFRDLGYSTKLIPDTGELCQIQSFMAETASSFWDNRRVFVIAEAGSNWRMGTAARDRAMARALIDVAADAGADAVKFQTYRPETVYVKNAGQSEYLAEAGIKEDISDIFADLAMPYEMLPELAGYCAERKIAFMSTGFSPDDFAAIDPHVSVHKIASYEISHPHLLRLAAKSGKPLILSTGASHEEDIAWAVETFRKAAGRDLCLMQCTADYPASMASLNLKTLPWLQQRFGVAAGLSDHSREPAVGPVAAVALGAKVIEKHFTLDNRMPGPDHSFALEPGELSEMVRQIRLAETSLGDGIKRVLEQERELAAFARRGLQAIRDIAVGEILEEGKTFAILRPGSQTLGVHPRYLDRIEGRVATRAIRAGEGLSLEDGEKR